MYYKDAEIILRKMEYYIENGVTKSRLLSSVQVCAALSSVTRAEFYTAAQAGMKADLTFTVYDVEYDNQQEIEYNQEVYLVVRTFQKQLDKIELVCTRRDGK